MKLSISILLIGFLLTSCYNKIDVPKGTPRCVKKQILKDDCISKVLKVEYENETVFYFQSEICDDYWNFYINSKCKICNTYNSEEKGCTFYGEITNETVIWKKE